MDQPQNYSTKAVSPDITAFSHVPHDSVGDGTAHGSGPIRSQNLMTLVPFQFM